LQDEDLEGLNPEAMKAVLAAGGEKKEEVSGAAG